MASLFRRFLQPKAPAAQLAPPAQPPAAVGESPEIASLYAEATEAYQAKDFNRAIPLYDRVIALQPDHAEAYYKRANALKDLGQLQAALESYDAAVRYKPDFSYAWCNRGFVQQSLGLREQALASFDESIRLNPDDIVVHFNRATLLQGMSRWEEALASHDRVVALNPQLFQAWLFRGNVLRELKKPDAALSSFQRALEIKPDLAEAHYNRGVVLESLRQPQAALASYERAIELNPGLQRAHFNRAGVLRVLKQPAAALEAYDRAISLEPGHVEAQLNRASVLMALKQQAAALEGFDRVLALRPDSAEAHLNRGIALNELERGEEALVSCERALALRPDYAEAYSQRAFTLSGLRRYEEALQENERAIALQPELPEARFNLGVTQLMLGDYAQGWQNFEWRWRNAVRLLTEQRVLDKPLWLGEPPIAGKRLLIHCEQGLGDALEFCRFAKSAADLGATVFLEVPTTLVGLLRGLDERVRVIAEGSPLPEFDYHCPIMSLPLALKTTLETVPYASGYLRADPRKVVDWQARLGERRVARIGLVWSGNPKQFNDRNRSYRLARLIGHLPRELQYVCLQKEIRPEDEQTLAANPWIATYNQELTDFEQSAALCENLDLVISVCTSVAHLSGALGKQTWVLLTFDADWRWLHAREDSPWYGSARLYRQQSFGDWEGVFARVGADLRKELVT